MDAFELFALSNREASVLLSGCESTPGLELCHSELGEVNLLDTRANAVRYVYDQKGAMEATFRWRQQFSLLKIDLCTVFGVGLGYEWQVLKPWLDTDPNKKVIFIEDDLGMLFHFLKQPIAETILKDPQTRIYYVDDGHICLHVAEILAWNQYRKRRLFAPSSYYKETRPKSTKKLEQKLGVVGNGVETVLHEFSTFGNLQFRSFFKNISSFKKARFGSDLFSSFQGIPAIVVGAGPSLQNAFSYLRSIQDSVLIFSGGTATNALLEEGICPHFSAAVDPNPAQYMRLKQIQPFALPLFYQSRVLPEGITPYEGELLYLRGGNGQPLIEWVDTELGIDGPLVDGGHSVSNMIVELAHLLGCGPIMMVGYDLSYPGGKMYPESVREGLSEKEMAQYQKPMVGRCTALGNDDQEVATEEKWITEAAWLLDYATKHPELELFNGSLYGLRMGSIPCMEVSEFCSRYGKITQGIGAKVHKAIMEARPLPFSQEKMFSVLQEILESVQRCMTLLVQIRLGDVLAQERLEKEPVFEHFLKTYSVMFDKKIAMQRLFHEAELTQSEEAAVDFERRQEEEKLQFLSDGLPLLAQWIRNFSASSIYDGMFPQEKIHLNMLEPIVPVPEYLQ